MPYPEKKKHPSSFGSKTTHSNYQRIPIHPSIHPSIDLTHSHCSFNLKSCIEATFRQVLIVHPGGLAVFLGMEMMEILPPFFLEGGIVCFISQLIRIPIFNWWMTLVWGQVVWIPIGSHSERDCYWRVTLEFQTTGPQTNNQPLLTWGNF